MSRPPFPSGWSSIPLSLKNLTLANSLPVGQSFLWHRHAIASSTPGCPTEEFSRAVDNPPRVVCLRQSPSHLYYTGVYPNEHDALADLRRGITKDWVNDYFQLKAHPELEKMYDDWRARDPELFGKVEVNKRAVGVRVLRQDPWECLIAFITSTNNHIPRITSLLHRFSQSFSPPLVTLHNPDNDGETTYHLFPTPTALPTKLEALLRSMGFGYRASFIESSLQTLEEEFKEEIEAGLLRWRNQDVDTVREKLVALKGVGRKVADCVMLMCMDKPSLIPIDTHVAAIAARHPAFPSRLRNKPMSKQVYDETQQFLLDRWGPMGGWCQAVMFAADLPEPKPKVKVVKTKVNTSVTVKRKLEEVSPTLNLKRTRSATRLELKQTRTIVTDEVKMEE
ncbi:N-glycosylase/DNA lyase [Kwoniella mangroviensis CBS 10435]|uniref:DNA-(apurinic or apyrimidinic site) lyase n=1 Tax=Kwoniella mangroviensis CBS 10435 TaxID=1331196 RepID=A0A1B9IJ16_9TREE|nr:N-glycosylase/DNA lyase [Kwoniella mangroviensis CBS 10435]